MIARRFILIALEKYDRIRRPNLGWTHLCTEADKTAAAATQLKWISEI